jgi:hypothetical protein
VFGASYHGRTLRDWLLLTVEWEDPNDREEAALAISALCSNKLPELVAALEYDPAPREAKLKSSLGWMPDWLFIKLAEGPLADRRQARAVLAGAALDTLGPEAAPALPQLETLAAGTNNYVSLGAYGVLMGLGTNGMPSLVKITKDEKHPCHMRAINNFNYLIAQYGTNAAIIPLWVVEECAKSSDATLAGTARAVLDELQPQSSATAPTAGGTQP